MPQHCRPPPPFTRIIDTGTSHHNLALGDGDPQHYVRYTTNTPQVMIPNGANITAHAHYNLKLQTVSHKPQKLTYYRVSNTCYSPWANCVTMTALPSSQNKSAPSTINKTNLSSPSSATIPRDYTSSISPGPTTKTSARQTTRYQQPTSKNISNIFINVPSPQHPEHGSRR